MQVDGEDKGKAPIRVEVSAEPHQVVVYQAGKKLYDEFLDVATGDEVDVKVDGRPPRVSDDGETATMTDGTTAKVAAAAARRGGGETGISGADRGPAAHRVRRRRASRSTSGFAASRTTSR